MTEYRYGDIVTCKTGKYKNQEVVIDFVHILYTPTLYTCKTSTGKAIALFHNELESKETDNAK